MTYVLSARERKLVEHLQVDHETFRIRGQLPPGIGDTTLNRLTALGLLDVGIGRFGDPGWRLSSNGWLCMYGKTNDEMMASGEPSLPLKIYSWPPTIDGSARKGVRRKLMALPARLVELPPRLKPLP